MRNFFRGLKEKRAIREDEELRVRPVTIFLVVIFILSAIVLLGVINLSIVRERLEQESVFWILRLGLGVMIISLVLYLVFLERAHAIRISKQLKVIEDVNRRLKFLLEAGKEIGSSLELSEILNDLIGYAFSATRDVAGAVYLYDKSTNTLKLALARGVDESKLVFKEFPLTKGLIGEASANRETICIDDMSAVDRRDNVFFGSFEPKSMIIVPIVERDKFLGVLVTANEEPHAYSPEEKRIIQGFAELAGLPIANAQLYRIARRSLDVAARQRGFTESVLEQMFTGIITCDSDGRIAIFNRMAQALTGFKFEEKHQMMLSAEASLDANPLAPLEKSMLQVMENPEIVLEGEAVIRRKDGDLMTVEYRTYPVRDDSKVLGAACVFVGAGKAAEKIEGDLSEYRRLIRAFCARVEMLYMEPLSRVLERIKRMDKDAWSNSRDDMVEILQAGFETFRSLVEQFEEYLECVSEREWETQAKFELGEMVSEAVQNVRKKWGLNSVGVNIEVAPNTRIFGNGRLLRTAIEKVLENAMIASLDGGRRVTIRTRLTGGDSVRLEICDTGPGMSDQAARGAFVPFFSTREGHAGLGLSVAKCIMKNINGDIGFEKTDEGAVFYLDFPLKEAGN